MVPDGSQQFLFIHGVKVSYKIEYIGKTDFLIVETRGVFSSLNDLDGHCGLLLKDLSCRGQRRVLMDFSELVADLEPFHATAFAEMLLEKGVPALGIRFAAHVRPEDVGIAKAFETACCNRSIRYKAFVDRAEAEAWLTA